MAALTDLREMLNEVEQMDRGRREPGIAQCKCCGDTVPQRYISAEGLCEGCYEEAEEEDDCPECNDGEVYEGELDIMCCGRCDGTGTLS